MSRIIEQIATVQFQVQTRQASATMQALQEAAKDLARDMDSVNEKIAALGKDVPQDNPQLLNYQNMLRGIKKDYDDVMKAQRDFMRGAKAADQLWKAAQEQNIESLSFRSIKSGISGLRKRQEGLSAGDAKDMQDWRIIQNVIQEADRIVKEATADVQNTIQVIRDGGKVSEQAMRQTINALRDLRSSVDETDADFYKWGGDLDFMEGKLKEFTDAQRRARGEMVDANDARREALKLTKEGAEAAKKERDAADEKIASLKKEGEELIKNRELIKQNIENTRKEIDEQHKLIEKKHSELVAAEGARKIIFDADRAHIEGLQTQAKKERALANEKSDAAEKQMRYTDLLQQQTDKLGQKVVSLQEKLAKMNAEPVKPNPVLEGVKQGAEEAKASVAEVKKEIAQLSDFQSEFVQMSDADFKKFYKPDQYPKKTKTDEGAAYKYLSQAQSHRAWGNVENADEIAKNAEENYRRVLFEQAKSGKLNIEKELAYARKQLQQEIYEANIGKSTPVEVHNESLEFKIATLEKLLEVTKKVHAEENVAIEKSQQTTAATKEETQATETQEELEGLLTEAQKQHKASQEQLNKEREKSAKLQGEAIEQGNKAAAAEGKVADATSKATEAQAKYNIKMEEGLQDVKNMENAQTDMQIKLDGQEQQLKENSEAYSKNAQDTAKAEADKRQAQELTIQQMEEMKALMEQENRETVPANTEKWRENEAEIERLDQKIREYKGEWMSLEEAQTFASKAGKDGFIATAQQLQQAQQAMERYRDTLVKTIQQKQRDGDVTDKEEQELAELEQQMKDLKFEQDNFNMSHKKMQNLLSEPTKATDLDELKAAIKRADGELHRMQNSLGENSKEYQEFAGQVKNAKNVLKEMEGQAKATASAWDKAWSRLKTYVGMYMGFNIVWSKFTATGSDLMDLSDKMGEVRKTTGFTADEVGKLSDNLAKLDTRTNLTGLMEFSSLAGSIGMKTQEQVQGFTEAANMLAVSLPEMGKEASRTLMKIADATGDLEKNGGNVRETLERVGSTIIALRANSAAAAGPITDFVSRVGAVGAQAGISIDKIAALGATVDALGGRVEMSATALSRMIPAIRNNTFEVAKAIGMTEKELKGKTAMEQMVAIFKSLRDSAKGFDTSTEEGMNAMADSVEKALGRSTSMQDVMKELNQQGARAGIVFGLLSQNVDKLEEQLNIAGEAYQKNTALMDEYNKMNDTTAAKWAKLKNKFEEFFVGDSTQRLLGWLIDGLRKVIDLITEDGPLGKGIRYLAIYATMVKAAWAEAIGSMIISLGKYVWSMRESTIATEADTAAKVQNYTVTTTLSTATEGAAEKTNLFARAWGKLNNAMKANIITAIGTALIWLATTLWDAHKAAKEVAEAINRVKEKTDEEREAVSKLFNPLKKANLEEAEKKRLINEINSKYGSYLSKMLTEASNAQEIARAYEAINLQLERKNTLEGINTNKKRVLEQNKDVLDSSFNEMDNAVQKAFKKGTDASRISSYISGAVKDAIEQGLSADQMARQIESALKKEVGAGKMKEYIQIISGGTSRREDASSYIANAARRYYNTQMQVQSEVNTANKRLQADLDNVVKQVRDAAEKDVPTLVKGLNDALSKGTDVKKYTAKESSAVVEAFNAVKSYYDLHREDLTDAQKNKLLKVMGTDISAFQTKANAGGGGGGNGGGSNPYGDYNKVTDEYSKWNGDDLVNRRKEMLQRVRALANGADVQKVLSEDAKFISDAVRKNIKTTEQAIEWYNTERLKIQEALHAKHLTNTGDWLDPKKGAAKRTSQLVQDEMKYYLDELDAYYTERKAKIQEAQNDQEISEAEARNRTLANEAEWRQRRAELQQLYTDESVKVTKEELDAILSILSERTGDTEEFIQKDIASVFNLIKKVGSEKSKAAMDKIFGDIKLKLEQDFLKQRNAIGQHMKAIQDIIDKERPFNGITKNLETNLTTMGILSGHMEKELAKLMKEGGDIADFNRRQAEEQFKELTFFLAESEHAYTTTAEEVMRRAADAGLTEWVEYMKQNPKMQEGLMAQLRLTFDSVHEAIKKEASLLKKEAETMWNNILMPDGMTTLKQAFDQTISTLGIEQGRVSRANNLIGAGQASEGVADKLAIQQIKVQMAMQKAYYDLMKQRGQAQVDILEKQSAELREQGKLEEAKRVAQDAQHARMALNLATTKEQTEQLKLQEDLAAKVEESQARLYKELKSWADIFTKGLQGVFEAVNFYNSSDYNNLAVARAGGSYNKKTTKTTSYSTSSKQTDTGKHSTSTSASSTSTKTNKTDSSDASQASKTSYSDTNRDQSTNRSATSDTHSTTNTSQAKTSTTTTEKIQNYYIIDNAGTKDAVAREVEMSEEEYYEKKIELDRDNAIKEAWKNLLDELNMKMSETITDQINAMFQDAAVNANTDALGLNTAALAGLTAALTGKTAASGDFSDASKLARDANGMALDESGNIVYPIQPTEGEEAAKPLFPTSAEDWEKTREQMGETFQFAGEKMIETNEMLNEAGAKPLFPQPMTDDEVAKTIDNYGLIQDSMAEKVIETGQMVQDAGVQPLTPQMMSDEEVAALQEQTTQVADMQINAQNAVAANKVKTGKQMAKSETSTDQQMTTSANSMYAKMIQAANLYGIAYQAMSNDNLNTAQKFEMIAVQAAGQAAISALTASMSQNTAQVAADTPAVASKTFAQLGPIGGPAAFAAITALLGGLLGVAVSKIAKSKQEIAQATGASASATNVSAGKLMTGMLTYGEGNVNEFTDPSSLTPGRSYNVDSADGKTYRARYMGADPKTHLTNGPEFHLVGERGREAIIDAHTTRLMQMDDTGIWQAIQTLYNGGSLRHSVMRRKGRGMAAFADGNIDEFETMADGGGLMAGGSGFSPEQMMALQASIDRQSDLLERAMTNGIHAYFDVYGKGGLIDSYDSGKKTVTSHGERY